MCPLRIIVVILLLFCLSFYGRQLAYGEAQEEDLVYLKVERATASSFDTTPDWAPEPNPLAPVDGNLDTRWSPELGKEGEWIYFDFGQPKVLSKIIIRWERAYATKYEILISDDAKKWKRLALLENQDGGTDEIEFSAVSCRYVKLIGLKYINPNWGFSMWEFEMYGPKSRNPSDKPIDEVFPERKIKEKEKIILVFEEPLPSPASILKGEFQKGVGYIAYHETLLAQEASDELMEYLSQIGIKHISLITAWYQNNLESSKIYPEPREAGRTPCDEALAHAINKAHSLGMKVMLKPHLDVQTDEFRGYIYPEDAKAWFKNYKKFILHYAELAAKYNVELFCIGTELGEMTLSTKENDEFWNDLISEVRNIYKGPLVYAANHDEYEQVSFWENLDFIGIDAYFPLTNKNEPTEEELVSAWEKWASKIEEWRDKKKLVKPVIFTEIGYASSDGCNKEPWKITSEIKDEAEQAQSLEAALLVMTKKDWFDGLYWWGYFPQTEATQLGYSLKGKEGEKVLSDWYRARIQ